MNERPSEADWRRLPSLFEGVVVVWWMAIESPPGDAVARWFALLDEEEQTRADRFRFAADREIFIAAHALTRALLSTVGGLPAPAWRFVVAPAGKPAVAPALDRTALRFNLSHTKGLVACAVGLGYDVGVDVEANDRVMNELDLAEHFFAPDEVSFLRGIAVAKRRDAFFRIWTLKEAYIKATGAGLACPLHGFAFGLNPIGIRFRADTADNPANWQFLQWQPTARHLIALAARCAPAPLRVIQRAVAPEEL